MLLPISALECLDNVVGQCDVEPDDAGSTPTWGYQIVRPSTTTDLIVLLET